MISVSFMSPPASVSPCGGGDGSGGEGLGGGGGAGDADGGGGDGPATVRTVIIGRSICSNITPRATEAAIRSPTSLVRSRIAAFAVSMDANVMYAVTPGGATLRATVDGGTCRWSATLCR